MKGRVCCLLLIVLFASGPSSAQGPQRIVATYHDWTVACSMPPNGERSCEMWHVQTAPGDQDIIGRIIVGRLEQNGPLRVALQTPPNVWLETGAQIILSKNSEPLAVTFRWCMSNRCQAELTLAPDTVAKLRAQTEPGEVRYKEASERDVVIAVSFSGFAAALDYMEKQQ